MTTSVDKIKHVFNVLLQIVLRYSLLCFISQNLYIVCISQLEEMGGRFQTFFFIYVYPMEMQCRHYRVCVITEKCTPDEY